MILSTDEVKYKIGATTIIKGISISSKEGSFIGVIGPNGSGKSTLLKCIYRVLKPTKGAVLIDGKEINQMSVKETARKISVVSQHNYYNFDFTIEEVVLMGRSPYKKNMQGDSSEDYEICREALREVGMEKLKDRIFSTLSGGEQQRVILARAIAQQTPIMILDEPTNHLDIKYQLQLLNTVKNQDKTIISAFHDLNIAAMYSDYIYVLKDGEIYDSGRPEDILSEKLIYDIYGVKTKINMVDDGYLNIQYIR